MDLSATSLDAVKMLARASRNALKNALRPVAQRLAPMEAGLPPELWGLTPTLEGGLSLEGVELAALRAQHGSPLHVVHARRLAENLAAFGGDGDGDVPCAVAYSYKTNPISGVLRFLHERGAWAEVISAYELWLALKLGVPPARIVYNGAAKSQASVEEAIRVGVGLLNLNSPDEIAPTARIAARLGRRPRVGMRVSLAGGWSGQFGAPVEGGGALAAFDLLARTPELELVGLHAHLGVQIRAAEQAAAYVRQVLAFVEALEARLRLRLEVLDLGGSLAIPTVAAVPAHLQRLNQSLRIPLPAPDYRSALTIPQYVWLVRASVGDHFRRVGRPPPRVVFEPGRSLTGNAQLLLASVLALNSSREPAFAILDAGINLAECVRHEYHQVFSVSRSGQPARCMYSLAGPICSPGDVLYQAARLPELAVGDALAIMDAGAYFVPFSTSFSFPQPGIVMIDDGRVVPLRRAETFEDMRLRER